MLETDTITTVHQRLRDEHGLAVSLASFRRYCWAEFPDETARERVRVPRPPTEPGEEAQVDCGYLSRWLDPQAGRMRRVWAFVMVLTFSRHMFLRPVLRLDATAWSAAHVAAYALFGGVPARRVIDYPRTGVDCADSTTPKPTAPGILVDPARWQKPRDKPRVERPMAYIRDSLWAGHEWASERHMQEDALRWCREVAGERAHRNLEGASWLALFEAVEVDALWPLRAAPFGLAAWSKPRVGPDCHVRAGTALYSVPWRHTGRQVDARKGERTVEVFVDGSLIKTHGWVARGRRTDHADNPPEKVAFFMRTPVWCCHRAVELGPAVAAVVEALLVEPVLHRLRSAQGVLRLAERHDPVRLEGARALAVGEPACRTVGASSPRAPSTTGSRRCP